MRRFGALALALALAACAQPRPELPSAPVPAGPDITISAQPVPLDPTDPRHNKIGDFSYAGGMVLTSAQTSRLHGLSDLKVWPDGRVLIVGDEGDLVEARLALDYTGGPSGLINGKLTSIIGEDGQPLRSHGKAEADSEGIAELANGDRLISLEEDDRILLYPRGGGLPRQAPKPHIGYVFNKGMEGLAAYPAGGPDAYLVGIEATGDTYICHLASACVKDRTIALSDGYELSALEPLSSGRLAVLLRAFDPLRGVRIVLRIVDAKGAVIDELHLARPLTVDNYEGLASAPSPNGGLRFYLIADDNFSKLQRTLFVAFDWRPGTGS